MGVQTSPPFLKAITKATIWHISNGLVAAVDESCWIHKALSLVISDSATIEGENFMFILILVLCAVTSAYRRFFKIYTASSSFLLLSSVARDGSSERRRRSCIIFTVTFRA